MNDLKGLSAFSLTPMDAEGRVDCDHLQRLVARLAATEVSSIGVLGSTGSYMYLAPAERDRAIKAAVEAAGSKPVLAGIGALTTHEVLRHAAFAETAGAAALLLAPVSYLPLTDADFEGLVRDVVAVSDLPVCLYNNPGTTHFSMSANLVCDLSQIAGVAGVKNPSPASGATGQIAHLRANAAKGFVLGYSGDALISGPLAAGADAWYSVIAGTIPDYALRLWKARGDAALLEDIHAKADPLWDLFRAHGGIRVVPHITEFLGLGAAPLPKPLEPLSASVLKEIEAALEKLA